MPTVKGQPRGYFEKLMCFDSETTGLCFNGDDPSVGHQAISWGIIIADQATLKPIEELYVEIQPNEQSLAARKRDPKFGKYAEGIHGLTFDYLMEHGVTEENACEQIGSLVVKHFGTNSIRTLGHNSITFDLWFFKRMFRNFGIELKFGNRHYDTNSIGWCMMETFNSDDLFEMMGFDARGTHNALEDARMTLETARRLRLAFKAATS